MQLSEYDIRNALKLAYQRQDKEGLWQWIRYVFGVEIPREACCSDHQAPLDFVASAFFQLYPIIIALANRSGGKTIDFSILDVLNSYFFDECETATVGAIEEQAKKCYRYFQGWCYNVPIINNELVSSLQSETYFKNNSLVQILTGTVRGVNSPHPHKAFIDEIDLMSWEVLQEALNMAQSSDLISGQTILTSTRKYAGGVMDKLIEDANTRGIKVFSWCIWEVVEPYPTDPEMRKVIEQLFPEMPEKVKTKKTGYFKWKDLIARRRTLDDMIWESQWLCRKPETTGLMYPQFIPQMYPKGHIVDADFIERWKETHEFEYYILEDFGYGEGHPDVTLFAMADFEAEEILIFDALYLTQNVSEDVIRKVKQQLRQWGLTFDDISGWICDPAGLTEMEERRRAGMPILEKVDEPKLYKILNGAPIIRTFLRDRKLYISEYCDKLIEEFNLYRKKKLPSGEYTQDPEKKNDHGPDALRYGMVKLFPAQALGSFGEEEGESELDWKPITSGMLKKRF